MPSRKILIFTCSELESDGYSDATVLLISYHNYIARKLAKAAKQCHSVLTTSHSRSQ